MTPKNSPASILQIHRADPDTEKRRLQDLKHLLAESEIPITYAVGIDSVALSLLTEESDGVPVLIELRSDGTWVLKNA
jgi:hypothetical protein